MMRFWVVRGDRILIEVSNLLLYLFRRLRSLNFHMSKLQARSRFEKSIFKDLVEMSSCDDFWCIFEVEQVF